MSRLIVKNLPNKITAEKLKEIFGKKGEITDVQLKFTKDGKFRNFGFIGYKSEDQADDAKQFFNGTCIKTSRITVENCTPLGSEEKPKSWSKYASDSSAFKKKHNKEDKSQDKIDKKSDGDKVKTKFKERDSKIKEILERHKDDPLFEEFMEVHGSRLKKALWGNDTLLKQNNNKEDVVQEHKVEEDLKPEDNTSIEEKLALQKISDLEYMKSLMKKKEENTTQEDEKEPKTKEKRQKKPKTPKNITLYHVKLHGLPFNCKKRNLKDFFKPLIPFTIRIPRDKKMKGFCYVGFKKEEDRTKALMKSKTFLGENRILIDKYDKKSNFDENNERNMKSKSQQESLEKEESIAESGKIFVRNLPYVVTEEELQQLFEKYGPIAEVNLPVDKVTHSSKGFAHVTYVMPEHAVGAFTALDGTIFCGRMLHLLPGKQKADDDTKEEDLTFKQKKEKLQKSQSSSSHNWNTLFLGANAVADVIAETFNTTKEKLLEGSETTSAAVKLALGETHLVASTRKFLEDNGVSLNAFNQEPKKRSKTIILLKNLPAQTTYNEINDLFKPFGLIARIIIPPFGITALVEFVEPSEARQAFSKLAYSKFKYLPLYLEWAPNDAFLTPAKKIINENTPTDEAKNTENEKNNAATKQEEEEEEVEENSILYVKGLNFETKEQSLREHFEKCGAVHSVTIAMKKNPHKPGEKLSMGYGFIQFYKKKSAEKALKTLQLSTLDDKQIELKRSERTGSVNVRTAKKETAVGKQTGTKILVRNVPFQAKQQEIMEIFRSFGEIKALRMPKKMVPGENRHRGFCFVEYINKGDAKNAFLALCQSTHLYGRRLVLEWAKLQDDDETLTTIRKRTAEMFLMENPGGKKSKKAVAEMEDLEENEE